MELPSLDHRELIPVRLIPFITGFSVGPQSLAWLLAHKQGLAWPVFREEVDKLFAYHLTADGTPARMLPKEWDTIVSDFTTLEKRLRLEERFEDEHSSLWRQEAVALFPAKAFVWRDEFEAVFHASFNRDAVSFIGKERDGSRELNYDPYIEPRFSTLVWEGFESFCPDAATDKSAEFTEKKQLSAMSSERSDALADEIESAIQDLKGIRSPKKVMSRLKEYAGKPGSCVVEALPEGIRWKGRLGATKTLDLEALRKRLDRKTGR